jgi:hypothetical protein
LGFLKRRFEPAADVLAPFMPRILHFTQRNIHLAQISFP